MIVVFLVFMTTGCIRVEPFTFNITDVVLAHDFQVLDNKEAAPVGVSNVFSTRDPKIVLCYQLQSGSKLGITYRWFMGDKLLLEHSGTAGRGGICTSAVPNDEHGFAPGSYRVEILVEGGVFRTAEFVIR
jgi:hypothetical protein